MQLLMQTWFPGVALGAVCLVYGLALGFLATRKRARRLTYGLHYCLIALCLMLLAAAVGLYWRGGDRAVVEAYAITGGMGLLAAYALSSALKSLYG